MTEDTDFKRRIRERAFHIWIDEGQPEGKDKEHWEKAEKVISGGEASPPLQPTEQNSDRTHGESRASSESKT